ncbi:hypothetical protein OOZ51_19300 [Arthrobacter sp. MI7-26]|uniref:hypothetical protein n=1 Tax=Arthrobacter sp. MI7-26 TaxID=2993653 RepID=UPI0022488F2B|nr:hypothetical protein [Arthrobacter sp. MI7-26]MCX2749937.1 hypothetical protein [Arthrobacter sp. MI7-26]
MNASQSSLIGFAVLRANYDAQAPSYVDNFRSFALDILCQNQSGITCTNLAQTLRSRFGLTTPDLVVEKILKRAVRDGDACRDGEVYRSTDKGQKNAPGVTASIARYERQRNELVTKYTDFINEKYAEHSKDLSLDPAGELARYLEYHAVPLLSQSLTGRKAAGASGSRASEYVISKFIAHLADVDQTGFGYVEDAVKGAILASVVTLDTSTFAKSLKGLSIYLDTPVLINALGYSGAAQQQATLQMIRLAQTLGATTFCFDHSLKELDGVLASAEGVVRAGGRRREGLRPIDLHFQESRTSPSDIALARDRISMSLAELEIERRPKPDGYKEYGLDEGRLEELIQSHIHYRSDGTRRYDVDSLSAIHRLRRGSSPRQFEKCGYVLITDNESLVRAVEKLDQENHEWPLAMTDGALAAILWVRSPTVGADLPRKQILATAYAGMQPDSHLWARYLEEVAKLESRGVVNADDAVILRATTVGRTALMEETLGDEEYLSADSAVEVLGRIKSDIERPWLQKMVQVNKTQKDLAYSADVAAQTWLDQTDALDKTAAERDVAQRQAEVTSAELLKRNQESLERDAVLRAGAEGTARRTINTVLLLLLVPSAAIAILKFLNPPWMNQAPNWFGFVAAIFGVLLVVVATTRHFAKGTVREWLAPLEGRMSTRIEGRRRRLAGLPSAPSRETAESIGTP